VSSAGEEGVGGVAAPGGVCGQCPGPAEEDTGRGVQDRQVQGMECLFLAEEFKTDQLKVWHVYYTELQSAR